MAVTPVFIPTSLPVHPQSLRPVTSPNDIETLWDAAQLSLKGTDIIAFNVDSHVEDMQQNDIIEVSNLKQKKDHPTAPVTYLLKSDNIADDKPVQVQYLDEDKEYKEAIFILDGTTPVELPLMFRVFSVANASSDLTKLLLTAAGLTEGIDYTLGETVGEVLIYEQGSAGTSTDPKTIVGYSQNFAGNNLEMQASFSSHITIPKGYTGYAFGFDVVVGKNDEITFTVQSRAEGGPWVSRVPFTLFEGERSKDLRHRQIPELVDVRAVATKTTTAANVPVSFSYQLLLIRNVNGI